MTAIRAALIDDGLCLAVLAGLTPGDLAPSLQSGPLVTTGCWWFRACRAVVGARGGRLTRHLSALPVEDLDLLLQRLKSPPPELVQIVGVQSVAFTAALLADEHGLNLLNAEALAVAVVYDADLFVTSGNESSRLQEAARARKRLITVIAAG